MEIKCSRPGIPYFPLRPEEEAEFEKMFPEIFSRYLLEKERRTKIRHALIAKAEKIKGGFLNIEGAEKVLNEAGFNRFLIMRGLWF